MTEPHNLDARLREIETTVAVIEAHTAQTRRDIAEVKQILLGNGKIGLTHRIDRLEQKQLSRNKHFWVLWTAIIGALAAAVIPLLVAALK